MNLPDLNLPDSQLRIRTNAGKHEVWDSLRKKYVAFTPEEYVRQQFTKWLIDSLNYPASLMNNEISLKFNGMNRRCDTLVWNKAGKPVMIVEYKAPHVRIDQKAFDQIVRYNMVFHVRYLVVTNGMNHYCCRIDYEAGKCVFQSSVPDYQELTAYDNKTENDRE